MNIIGAGCPPHEATEIRTLAERQMGEFLKETPKAPAGRPEKIGREDRPISSVPTLKEMGITKDESARAQKLADIPEEECRSRKFVDEV